MMSRNVTTNLTQKKKISHAFTVRYKYFRAMIIASVRKMRAGLKVPADSRWKINSDVVKSHEMMVDVKYTRLLNIKDSILVCLLLKPQVYIDGELMRFQPRSCFSVSYQMGTLYSSQILKRNKTGSKSKDLLYTLRVEFENLCEESVLIFKINISCFDLILRSMAIHGNCNYVHKMEVRSPDWHGIYAFKLFLRNTKNDTFSITQKM